MEKKLQPLKNKLLLFFFFVLSVGVFGQTLVNFPFTNTPAGNGLNPDFVDPSYDGVTLPVPSLTYGPSTVQYFNNNMLEFDRYCDTYKFL